MTSNTQPNASSIVTESTYSDGILAWEGNRIKDEEIITVVEGSSGYTIVSLQGEPFDLRITPASLLPKQFLDQWLFGSLPEHMEGEVYVLLSIRSGTGLATKFWEEMLQPVLEMIGISESRRTVVPTKSAESVKEFMKTVLLPAANKGKKQTVLMLSGDGGIVDSINVLSEIQREKNYMKPVVSLFPLGTGNALFHSLHKSSLVPSIYLQAIRTLLQGTPKSLPMFQAKFSSGSRLLTNEGRDASELQQDTLYGAVVTSYGLHSTLVADSDTTEYRTHGDKRFGLVANNLLFSDDGPHAYQAEVAVDGNRIERSEHGYLLMTMVSNLEKAFTISPDSKPLDGQMWLVHFGDLTGKEAMEVMSSAYDGGKHILRKEVGYERVTDVRVVLKEKGDWKWRRVSIDGAIVAVEEGGWFEVSIVEMERAVISIIV